jgi:phage tail-like protein
MANADIYRAYNFILDLGEGPVGYFSEVSGLNVEVESIEYREGGGAPGVRKLAGRVRYGDVTAKWGLTSSRDLWNWLMTAASGQVERRHLSVILVTPGGAELTRWNLTDAWPRAWRGAELDAMGNDVAIETIMFACEGIERA